MLDNKIVFVFVLRYQKLGREPSDEDCFFDLLSKFQSSRMDDQRCDLDEAPDGADAADAATGLCFHDDKRTPNHSS